MGGAVCLPCWLFGLRRPSTGAYRLLGGAGSWWQNGDLQESSYQWVLPSTSATSACPHSEPFPLPTFPGDTPRPPSRPAGMSGPGSYEITAFSLGPSSHETCAHPPNVAFLFSPVLWSSCNQTPLAFKAKCSGASSSWCQTPRLGSMMWGSELTPVGEPHLVVASSLSMVVEYLFW